MLVCNTDAFSEIHTYIAVVMQCTKSFQKTEIHGCQIDIHLLFQYSFPIIKWIACICIHSLDVSMRLVQKITGLHQK